MNSTDKILPPNVASPDRLRDPDQCSDCDVVIFDGECNFCRSQVRNLRRLDFTKRLSFLSLHDQRVGERYPDLSRDDLMQQMYVVDPIGQPHGGSEAVKYLSRHLPILWPVMPLLHLPGTAGIWRWGYKQIAKRRYQLAGKSKDCGDTCSIHFD